MTVSEIERDVPVFSRDMKTLVLKQGTVARYSIPRPSSSVNNRELLQRLPSHGANMPDSYSLGSSGVLPNALSIELRKISEEYDGEYFEFEGTSLDVAVYWEEWGGAEKIASLHSQLKRLAVL